jgi:hypothetical protein
MFGPVACLVDVGPFPLVLEFVDEVDGADVEDVCYFALFEGGFAFPHRAVLQSQSLLAPRLPVLRLHALARQEPDVNVTRRNAVQFELRQRA